MSREFINSHPDLGRLVEAAARQTRHRPPPHPSDRTVEGLPAQNRTLAAKISEQTTVIADLKSTIAELRRQRQLHLGAQLAAAAVDSDTHARLQLDHDRLAAQNTALERRLGEKERLIATPQEDLAASRQAHSDDIARLTADDPQVAVIRPKA